MSGIVLCISFILYKTIRHSLKEWWICRWLQWLLKHVPDLRTALVIIAATSEQVHCTTWQWITCPPVFFSWQIIKPKSSQTSLQQKSFLNSQEFKFLQQKRCIQKPKSHQISGKQVFPCSTTTALFTCVWEKERDREREHNCVWLLLYNWLLSRTSIVANTVHINPKP